MARILPGSLGRTFSGVDKTARLSQPISRAAAPDTPHGFDALAETLQHPLTNMAVAGISRIGDEMAYSKAVSEEKERVDKARFEREQAMEQAQNVSRYRQQLEQQAQDPNIQDAIRRSQAFEANRPGPVDLGYAGFQQTGMTSTGVPIGKTMGATGMPTGPGYDQYTHEDLLRMGEQQAELDAMRQQEAAAMQAIGPEVQERFIPKTSAEFQAAIAAETDPARRQQLLVESTRAVDVQPQSVMQAITGAAKTKIQEGVRKAGIEADKASLDAAKLELEQQKAMIKAMLDQAELDRKLADDESKRLKRESEIKLNEAKLKKFQRRMAASMRRGGGKKWFLDYVRTKWGGDFSAAVDNPAFMNGLINAAPNDKEFNAARKIIVDQARKTGLKNDASKMAINSEIASVDRGLNNNMAAQVTATEQRAQARGALDAMTPLVANVLKRPKPGQRPVEGFISTTQALPQAWYADGGLMEDLASKSPDLQKAAREQAQKLRGAVRKSEELTQGYDSLLKRRERLDKNYETVVPAAQTQAQPQSQPQAQSAPAPARVRLVGVRNPEPE